jgi:hypothetical protein
MAEIEVWQVLDTKENEKASVAILANVEMELSTREVCLIRGLRF